MAQAVQALAPKLGPEQAQAALPRLLSAIKFSGDSPPTLRALAQAVEALAPKLDSEQAKSPWRPSSSVGPYETARLPPRLSRSCALSPRSGLGSSPLFTLQLLRSEERRHLIQSRLNNR